MVFIKSPLRPALFLGPILFLLVHFGPTIPQLEPAAQSVLAITLWIGIWWVSECVPIPVSSLLPIVLLPLTGALPLQEVTASYGDSAVFLYLGGFLLAIAMETWGLHKRIALWILVLMGLKFKNLVLGFMLATGFLSMWISNTATALMMLPIGLGIIEQLTTSTQNKTETPLAKILLLSIAYSASIGGMATVIGSPTNTIFVGVIKKIYGADITFLQWMLVGFPIALIMIFVCWWYLTHKAFKIGEISSEGVHERMLAEQKLLGKMKVEEKRVLWVFGTTAFLWITRSFLINPLFPALNDTIIAIGGAIFLFVIPSSKTGKPLLDWSASTKVPWGILLLFGGGLAIASGFQETGLADWVGNHLSTLDALPLLFIILLVVLLVNFLTEITSNVATATMMMPVLASLALSIDVHPYGLMFAACLAASCAFMLPVATPPNAVVFGSGHLKIGDMVRAGFWLNLISSLLITICIYTLLPLLWKLDLWTFPDVF